MLILILKIITRCFACKACFYQSFEVMKQLIRLICLLFFIDCFFIPLTAQVPSSSKTLAAATLQAAVNQPFFLGTNKPFLNIAAGSGKTSYVSAVLNDPTDPMFVYGINFEVTGTAVSLQTTSSNQTVAPINNIAMTPNGGVYVLKISPAATGYSTITITANSAGGNSATYTVKYAVSAASSNPPKTIFPTFMADASGASEVDSNFMFVADDEQNIIRLYSRKQSGRDIYSTDITAAAGASAECDLEGSSLSVKYNNRKRIYWIGSLGNNKSGALKPDRNKVIATDIIGHSDSSTLTVKSYSNSMRSSLISWGNTNSWNFTTSAASGMIPKRIDGFNVEGLAVTHGGDTGYIGFRAPCVPLKGTTPNSSNRIYAVIAPVINFETLLNGNGLVTTTPVVGEPILFDLAGLGIRSIERVGTNHYVIVAGLYTGGGSPAVYLWDGKVPANPGINPITTTGTFSSLKKLNLPGLNELAQISSDGTAEGHPEAMITELTGNLLKINLICDNGTIDYYNDGTEAKSLANDEFKKFRYDQFTWSMDSLVTLNVSTGGNGSGSVILNPPGGVYPTGTSVTLTANATAGNFSGWTGDLSGSNSPAVLIMNSNKSVIANFNITGTRKKIAYVTDPAAGTYVNDSKILPALKADTNFVVTEVNATQTGIDYTPYDLVIFSEVPSSTAPGVAALEGINKPFLMMKVHSYKTAAGAWGWTNSTTAYGQNATETNIVVSDKSHPIFNGVTFYNINEVNMLSAVASSKGLTYMDPSAFTTPSGGAVSSVATVKNNATQSSILQMPAGITVAGTLIPKDFIQIGINSSSYANVTDDGVRIVLNAVYYLTKTPYSTAINLCTAVNGAAIFSNINGTAYQWQRDTCKTGSCFYPLTDNSNYSGSTTNSLKLSNLLTKQTGERYRCIVDGNISNVYTLKFTDTWTGAFSNQWENAANWSCGTLPDEYTDVIIKNGNPVLNSNTSIRSLSISNSAALTVNPAFQLTINQ